MRAEIVDRDGITVVRLRGGLVSPADVIHLRRELERVAAREDARLVLNTNGVSYLSSEVIGEVAVFSHRAWREGRSLRVVASREIPAFAPPDSAWLCEDEDEAVRQLA